jgi:hypothetical protein
MVDGSDNQTRNVEIGIYASSCELKHTAKPETGFSKTKVAPALLHVTRFKAGDHVACGVQQL